MGKPSIGLAKKLAREGKTYLTKTIVDPLLYDGSKLEKMFKRFNEVPYFPRPLRCASQIKYEAENILNEAEDYAASGTQEGRIRFASLFDVVLGMNILADSVVAAEDVLGNVPETELSNVVDDYTEYHHLDAVRNVQIFLGLKQLYSHYAERLKKDPSGFLLIKDVTTSLKDPEYGKKKGIDIKVPNFLVREYVIVGTELAATIYKKVYPLA